MINAEYFAVQPFRVERKRGAIVKIFAALFQTALLVTIVSVAYSQSLGDLANKEGERRKEIKSEKVITDEEAAKYKESSLTTNTSEQPPAKSESGNKVSPANKETPESDEPVDFEGKTESYWRKTMAEARQKVKELEDQATAITLKINTLQNDFYREDNGFKREGIQRELQKSYYEQDKIKEDLAKAKDALQDLEKEGRKSGAPPGWLAPGK